MQTYTSRVSLERYRADALHREAMCRALAADDPRYMTVAESAAASVHQIDARAMELRQASDELVRHRAVERASKLRAITEYAKARRALAVDAERLTEVLLPTPPAALKKVGISRAIEIVAQAAANLHRPECPASVREGHLPVVNAHIEKMRVADREEDEVRTGYYALRAALALFKAELETARVKDYATLVGLVQSRPDAEEFFLPAYQRGGADGTEDDDEEPEQPAQPSGGGASPPA